MNYYNEWDKSAAQWLRNLIAAGLIPPGDVDDRSITDVRASELAGYTQCHFFAGIGGWSRALQLAGWPADRPVWTGSCPCQPFSSAGRGRGGGNRSEKHLWPAWHQLIVACRPGVVFGEQVAHARSWLDGVCDDMEASGYQVRAAILPAYSAGKDHARERIYFACHADSNSQPSMPEHAEVGWVQRRRSESECVASANGISGRVVRLRAYGNAIVPQVGAAFVSAFMGYREAA